MGNAICTSVTNVMYLMLASFKTLCNKSLKISQ